MSTAFAELGAPTYNFDQKYPNKGVVDFAQIVEASQKLGFKGTIKMVESHDGFRDSLTPRAVYFAIPQALAMLALVKNQPESTIAYVGVEKDGQNMREYPAGHGSYSHAGPKVRTATRIVLNESIGEHTVDNWYAVDSKGTVAYRGIAS